MTIPVIIAVLAFLLYCFMAEWSCGAKSSPVIVTIMCRLVARHVKLIWKLLVGLIYFVFGLICIMEMNKKLKQPLAAEGGFTRFLDVITTPLQLLVDALVGILGLIAIGILFGLVALKDSVLAHPHFWTGFVIVSYLLWLVSTICELVQDEVVSHWTYSEDTETFGPDIPTRVLTKPDYITYAAGTFMLWIAILAFSGAWVATHFNA